MTIKVTLTHEATMDDMINASYGLWRRSIDIDKKSISKFLTDMLFATGNNFGGEGLQLSQLSIKGPLKKDEKLFLAKELLKNKVINKDEFSKYCQVQQLKESSEKPINQKKQLFGAWNEIASKL